MAAFRFRLQQLLQVRRAARDAQAAALSRARAAEDGARLRLEENAAHRERLLAEARGARAEPVDIDTWSAGRADYQGARRQEAASAEHLRAAEVDVRAAQGAYLDARREEQVLNRLRDRRQEEWRAGEAAAEQAALDDIAGRRGGGAGGRRG